MQWCLGEEWGVPRGKIWNSTILTPDPEAIVYTIDNYDDFLYLFNNYHKTQVMIKDYEYHSVDWETLAKVYDGIHLTDEGQWRTRFAPTKGYDLGDMFVYADLYGWDCESTLWLKWKFSAIKHIGKKRYQREQR